MSFSTPNPITIASFAERLARQQGQMGVIFAVVTAVSLGLVTLNAWQDMMKRNEDQGHRGR